MTETKSRGALQLEVRASKRSQRALRGRVGTAVALVSRLEQQRGGLLKQLADSQEGLETTAVLASKLSIENAELRNDLTMVRKDLAELEALWKDCFTHAPRKEVSSQHSEAVQYAYMRPFGGV